MKNGRTFRTLICAAVSAAILTFAAGCGESKSTESKPTADSGVSSVSTVESVQESKNKDETNKPDSTKKQKESKVEESSQVSETQTIDPEKDIKVTTLSVTEIPYNEHPNSSSYVKADVITRMDFLITWETADKITWSNVRRVDGVSGYDGKEYKFMRGFYDIRLSGKNTVAYYFVLDSVGKVKPSDFIFDFRYGDDKYSYELKDEIGEIPAEYYSDGDVHGSNLVNIDGKPYLLAGLDNGITSGSDYDEAGNYLNIVSKPYYFYSIVRGNDPKLDLSKFSYEPDEIVAQNYDTSKITVTITDGTKASNPTKPAINTTLSYVNQEDHHSAEELKELSTILDKMYNNGYLVYSGENGKIRIHF